MANQAFVFLYLFSHCTNPSPCAVSKAMAEDASIQPISYAQKNEEESEFQKIKRRLSMKVQSWVGLG